MPARVALEKINSDYPAGNYYIGITTEVHIEMQVKISEIIITNRKRTLKTEYVKQLAESINEIGLLNPITLSHDYKLLSGLHRLEAVKLLGMETIESHVMVSGGILYEELIEIDENLIRNDLVVLERGEQLKRRKEIYEEIHPETKQGGDKKSEEYKNQTAENAVSSFAEDTSQKTGIPERRIREEIQIARGIDDSVKDIIRDTEIADSKTDLLELARVKDIETQKDIVDRIVSGEVKNVKQAKRVITRVLLSENKQELPEGEFDIIYADPPWKYDFSATDDRNWENQYPVMELDDIKALKLPQIAEDSVLFLWATSPKLEQAMQVINAWGFEYKTCAVWDKEIIGCGWWLRGQHELLLIGIKGRPLLPLAENRFSSVYIEKRAEHSKKPEFYYGMIEKMCPDGKYIEIFARNKREGWSSWGNQV
jgi:N6-adenosine-specific RNA methylase IME4